MTATVDATLVARLAEHRTVGSAPRAELEWLATHGTVRHFDTGSVVGAVGQPMSFGLMILFGGRVSHHTEQGGVWRKVIEWTGGDVTGTLPYSRMRVSPGNSIVDEPIDALEIPKDLMPSVPVNCPTVTAFLVHSMLDRARAFKQSDSQIEKMASLGKLAAGLAHELNNPASAAARSATLLAEALTASDEASRTLGATGLTDAENSLLDDLRHRCLEVVATSVLTPLERADREDAIADWLTDHGADESFASPLAETAVTIGDLDALALSLSSDKLDAALRWVAAGCAIRALVRDIDRAASRVHQLVTAVKGFTYMDHATVPEPVDLAKGLTDTIAVLAAKARSHSASLTVDVPADLPRASGFGGELNQVWVNLIDNALDAAGESGRVRVTARAELSNVVVRVTDNGPGIPDEIKQRIFDPFFTTKGVGQGTGLGLDIVRRLVERNEGRVDVESAPGRTEFRVTLKLA